MIQKVISCTKICSKNYKNMIQNITKNTELMEKIEHKSLDLTSQLYELPSFEKYKELLVKSSVKKVENIIKQSNKYLENDIKHFYYDNYFSGKLKPYIERTKNITQIYALQYSKAYKDSQNFGISFLA